MENEFGIYFTAKEASELSEKRRTEMTEEERKIANKEKNERERLKKEKQEELEKKILEIKEKEKEKLEEKFEQERLLALEHEKVIKQSILEITEAIRKDAFHGGHKEIFEYKISKNKLGEYTDIIMPRILYGLRALGYLNAQVKTPEHNEYFDIVEDGYWTVILRWD